MFTHRALALALQLPNLLVSLHKTTTKKNQKHLLYNRKVAECGKAGWRVRVSAGGHLWASEEPDWVTLACLWIILKLTKLPFCLLSWLGSERGSDSAQPGPILGSKRYRSAGKLPFLSLITLTGTLISAFQLPLLFCKIIYTAFYIFNQALFLKRLLDYQSFCFLPGWRRGVQNFHLISWN